MSSDLRRSCTIDLAYPYHQPDTPSQRLRAVADYMEAEGLDADPSLNGPAALRLEGKIAALTGMPAAAWFPTGVMAQCAAARIHAEKSGSRRVLLHPSSHLELHEENAHQHLHALDPEIIGRWGEPVRAEDLVPGAACAFVELPQRHDGGALPDWATLQALKDRAAELDLTLHMDGARLWSCRPFYEDRSYAEIVSGFASVYVSLYKDIGAPIGAVLAGSEDFIRQARIWRVRMGGALVAPWPALPDALRLIDKRLEQMPGFVARASELAEALSGIEGLSVEPSPAHTNLLNLRLDCTHKVAMAARDTVAREHGVWLANNVWDLEGGRPVVLEITVGERVASAELDRIVAAVRSLADAIARANSQPAD
ncbi:beta-eliminating lyase-related protein [Maricaulis sp.]|uniref:threonine aldolase family protein n=1 Tax=Maricaulis sp. TaxID=1486257 RepID=UPI00260F1DA8|nr:beta-eliminating lyase-related protein [Maricaulis sp.]